MISLSGVVLFRYHVDDVVTERYAIVTLVADGILRPNEVFPAFGHNIRSLYRWQNAFELNGISGLLDRPKGSKPWRLKDAIESAIRERRERGDGYHKIAVSLGLKVSSVRYTVKRLGLDGPVKIPLDGELFEGVSLPSEAHIQASDEALFIRMSFMLMVIVSNISD